VPLSYSLVRLRWRLIRALHILHGREPADDLSCVGLSEALEAVITRELERARAEGRLTAEDEAYIEQETPPL
jgi:hypothetical protein